MRPPKYALEPLAKLREKKVDAAARDLASAVGQREAASRKRGAAERRRDAHDEASNRVRDEEAEALARGELRAADLAHADAWRLREESERAALEGDVRRARDAETRAAGAETQARTEVAARKADAQVVAKDRARWKAEQDRRVHAKEEEAAEEAWRPKR